MNSNEEDELMQSDVETDIQKNSLWHNYCDCFGWPFKRKTARKHPHAGNFKWKQEDLSPTIHTFWNNECGISILLPDAATVL